MAIIYSYPKLPFNKLTGDDLFVVTDVDSVTDNPTRSLSLNNVVKYIKESAGSGVGTINRIPKFKNTGTTTLEDSILLQDTLATSVAVNGDLTFADNKKILLGNSDDVKIYFDGLQTLCDIPAGNFHIGDIQTFSIPLFTFSRVGNATGIYQKEEGWFSVRSDGSNQKVFIGANGSDTLEVTDSQMLFYDNKKLSFGDSSDLQLYHDGSNSYIAETGTGRLIISGGSDVQIQSPAGEMMADFNGNNSVDLYYNNVKKFETTSTGITVTGTQSSFSGQVTIPTTPVASTDAASKAYVDGLTARKIFTSTSLDTTTDYNLVAATPIVWDSEIIKDSIYTHDNAVNPEQVTVTEAGTYRVYAMLTATSASTSRIVILLRIAVNGTATGRLGAGMYIRGQSGIDKSSATIEETMVLSANDIITITGERGSTIGGSTFGVSGASFFSIEKIA